MADLTNLPIFKSFDQIEKGLGEAKNLILKSPTGSGKSLGLPILLFQKKIVSGQILVVQPRRIAARSLATKAAQLINSEIGDRIGYQVRFENKTSDKSKVIYLTDGILFRKILSDRFLSRVEIVIFDEFHERSLQMDTSLALLKKLQETKRPNIRIILTSATVETNKLKNYLSSSKIIELFIKNYPVQKLYRPLQNNESLWSRVCIEIKKIKTEIDGDILIFVSGFYEISKIIKQIHAQSWSKTFSVYPLHGDMSLGEQERVIKKSEKRKIIVSTNIAETSLTIEGVRIVIDTGFAKRSSFDPIRRINVLLPQKISKSSADQRCGRAGRTSSGYCIRLWSENDHHSRSEMEIPSVLKLELSEIYLSLCAVDEIPQSIPWLEFPSESSFLKTKEFLVEADLIDKNNKITTKGLEVSKFPLSPSLGLGLIEAKRYGCLPAFSLILAYIDDRSPIIDKEFKEDIIVSQDSETFLENEASLNNSDLKLLLLIWVFAKRSSFSFKSCSNAGVHSNRCKIADQLAIRYCKLADTNVTDFSFLKTKKLPLVLLKIFSHQLAYSLSRGKKTFQSLNGSTFHLSKRSRVKDSNWVLPLKITEKIIKGQVSLEMEFVTEINEEDVISLFEKTILHKNEVFLNPETRKVVRRKFLQLGEIKFRFEESDDISDEEFCLAYVDELKSGRLSLKNWDSKVESFLNRINYTNENYPEYEIQNFDDDFRESLFFEICKGTRSWKEIKNRNVLNILHSMYLDQEIELLDKIAPIEIRLRANERSYRIFYKGSDAIVRVKIQDLYNLKSHPKIPFTDQLIMLEILAPNDRCVQVTKNLNEFWDGSYIQIKKELSGRYPKHEWR